MYECIMSPMWRDHAIHVNASSHTHEHNSCCTYECVMSHVCAWRMYRRLVIHETWRIHMCDVNYAHVCDLIHSYVWHDSFTCATWLIHTLFAQFPGLEIWGEQIFSFCRAFARAAKTPQIPGKISDFEKLADRRILRWGGVFREQTWILGGFSVESSLQGISSNSLLRKWNNSSIVM